MARGAQLVQAPERGRSPNAYQPIPTTSSAAEPLQKSLFPIHLTHSHAAPQGRTESNTVERREPQHAIHHNINALNQNDIPSTLGTPQPTHTHHRGTARSVVSNPADLPHPAPHPFHDTDHLGHAEAPRVRSGDVPEHLQRQYLDAYASTNDHQPAEDLDPFKMYDLGVAICKIATRMMAEMAALPPGRTLSSFPVPPDDPASFPVNPSQQNIRSPHWSIPHSRFQPLRVPEIPHVPPPTATNTGQLHPDPDILLNPEFAFDDTLTQANDCGYLPGNGIPPGYPTTQANTVHVFTPNLTYNLNMNINTASPVPMASGSGLEAPPVNTPAPNSNPRICEVCGKGFDRRNDLLDHMYTHDGVKRHKCQFCGTGIAYRNNMGKHQRKCKAKAKAKAKTVSRG